MFTIEVLKRFRKLFGHWMAVKPSQRKPRPMFKPRLEWLEERWCPAGTDLLTWNPQGGSQDASLASNWYDNGQFKNGVTIPGPDNPITQDGGRSNSPIEIPQNMSAQSINVRFNYNNTLTIDDGASLSTSGGFNILNGNILTLVSGSGDGIVLTSGAKFTVSGGATLNLKDQANAIGGMTYLSGDGTAGEYLNNQGTVNWNGIAVAAGGFSTIDRIGVPVTTSGTFNADGGSGGDVNMVGGSLEIAGSDSATNNVSFYMTAGALSLKNNAMLSPVINYYQSGGSLTSDATPCTLFIGGGDDDINIAGGAVTVDNVAGSVSTLTFNAATVEINGEIIVSGLTTGGNSTRCDQLICKSGSGGSTVTLGTSSYLNVNATGGGNLGTGNQWAVMTYGSISSTLQQKWGTISYPTGMSVSTGATQVLVSN